MAKLDYYNRTHTGLSYSRQLDLHACPRKYELTAKRDIKGKIESGTFSYGHAMGAAVQSTIAGRSYHETIIDTWLAYTHGGELTESEEAGKKSIHHALINADMFYKQYHAGMYPVLDGWEVAKFTDPNTGETRPAVELTFVIKLQEGFTYEGHVDLTLYNPKKNRYMIVELKTTGGNRVHEAQYKNSNQALGYAVVLDAISGNLNASSSFSVLYMVYKSKSKEIIPMTFDKTPLMRLNWLNLLMSDVETIMSYEANGYPFYGESCFDYFHPCDFYDVCQLPDSTLNKMYRSDGGAYDAMSTPDFLFDINDLIERQEKIMAMISDGSINQAGEVDMLLNAVNVKG